MVWSLKESAPTRKRSPGRWLPISCVAALPLTCSRGHAGARVVVVDMGVAADIPAHPDLRVCKVAYGTHNIARIPAMSHDQALQCLESGAEVFLEQLALGLDILATGDMGIGNTTPSAAIAAAITKQPVEKIAGRGHRRG